jgi:hypothetical protein
MEKIPKARNRKETEGKRHRHEAENLDGIIATEGKRPGSDPHGTPARHPTNTRSEPISGLTERNELKPIEEGL